MTVPPNQFTPELLAAYVDGELDGDSRARVERWLANNPEALAELQAQRALSPANHGLWERAEPPEPLGRDWAAAKSRIVERIARSKQVRWRSATWVLAGLSAAGVAAAVVWIAVLARAPVAPPAPAPVPGEIVNAGSAIAPAPREIAHAGGNRSADPLDGIGSLPLADDTDVILERVPEFPAGWIVTGRHPIERPITLATEEELRVAEFAPGPAWPTGAPRMTTAPGDAPMIFAAKPAREEP